MNDAIEFNNRLNHLTERVDELLTMYHNLDKVTALYNQNQEYMKVSITTINANIGNISSQISEVKKDIQNMNEFQTRREKTWNFLKSHWQVTGILACFTIFIMYEIGKDLVYNHFLNNKITKIESNHVSNSNS